MSTEPNITLHFAPSELGRNNWYESFSVLGIAQRHVLYVNGETLELVYVVAPEGGSYQGIQRWADTPQTHKAWRLILWSHGQTKWQAFYDLQVEAERYVHEQAIAEVKAEMS